MIQKFLDVSLTGHSAILVVYFPRGEQPHELLCLDAAKAWELIFADACAFNRWAEERYAWVTEAIRSAAFRFRQRETVELFPS